jgi:hypothetical protein
MENLKVKTSEYKRELSFNEWVMRYNVSSGHQVKTNYYQGNPSCGIKPIGVAKYLDETPFERFVRVLFTKINPF